MTYNIHRCLGTDGRLQPERIAQVIAEAKADIVALQEVDVGRARTGGVDQSQEIADRLGMQVHFNPALTIFQERYGDAVLTSQRSHLVKSGGLPGLAGKPRLESRGALWVAVEIAGAELQVFNTHLGLLGRERVAQVDALLGSEWLGHEKCRPPTVLLGDLNAVQRSSAYRHLARELTPSHCGQGRRGATYPSRFPCLRLDHVFFRGALRVLSAAPMRSRQTRRASDHLPVVVDFAWDDHTSQHMDAPP